MRKVKVAVTQMSCSWNQEENFKKAEKLVRNAAKEGAQIILLQELFSAPYFCQVENYEYFKLATTLEENPAVLYFQKIAKELKVVLPISYFEKGINVFYNSIAIIDADGTILGNYRKTHIPTGQCYEEKFYFTPGDTGFKVWDTEYGRIGVGICWDQWFPETARSMALMGAEILLYPTAIGTEPSLPVDSQKHWQNTMCGHAAANIIPVIASNRVGTEKEPNSEMTFYGSSFIANFDGEVIKHLNRAEEGYLVHEFDLDVIAETRYSWGVFRDRRPEMYKKIIKN